MFNIKDLGIFKYFLGIEVAYSKDGTFLSQRKNTMDLLKEIGLLGGRATSMPLEPNLKLGPNDSSVVNRGRYQRLVDMLITYFTPNLT